jgi:hypothetical protein
LLEALEGITEPLDRVEIVLGRDPETIHLRRYIHHKLLSAARLYRCFSPAS